MGFLARLLGTEQRNIENPAVPLISSTILQASGQYDGHFGPVSPAVALTNSVVFACCRVIAETIASLPLVLKEKTPQGTKPAADHPLYGLLSDAPNSMMTSYIWRERMIYHRLLQGNSYDYIVRNNAGLPVELRPINPLKVEVGIINGKKVFKTDGEFYDNSDFIHVPNVSLDGVAGVSTITYARQSIGLALAAEQYGTRFFSQGFGGNIWVSLPTSLSEEQQKRMRESWQRAHTGNNAHSIPLLGGGAEIHSLGVPNDDAQFLQTRQFSVADIARWFRVPPHKIGDLTKSAFSNIEQQSIEFVSDTVRPAVVMIESELNTKLLSPAERGTYFFEFDLEAILRGDLESRYKAYSLGRQWGWLSADDIRARENLNSLPNDQGSTYLMPLNMTNASEVTPAALAAKAAAAIAAVGTNQSDEADDDQLADDAGDERAAQGQIEATAITLSDGLGRMARKESEAVRRAAGKPGSWPEFVQTFYGKHEAQLRTAIAPALTASAVAVAAIRKHEATEARTKAAEHAEAVAHKLCELHRHQLAEADPTNVETILNNWTADLDTLPQATATGFAEFMR